VKRLQPDAPSLNLQVKETMIKALRDELAAYVRELCVATNPPQSDSTSASGPAGVDDLGEMELEIQAYATHRRFYK
jgi:hypothetical protein